MHQLSGRDAWFLYLEKPNAPMRIDSITVYDQSTVPGGVQSFKSILPFISERLNDRTGAAASRPEAFAVV